MRNLNSLPPLSALRVLPAILATAVVGCSSTPIPTASLTPEASLSESTTLIVGGEDATAGVWPWMVALVDSSNRNNAAAQFCGGTLIARIMC
ncbi:MAG: trypsin-like serine protease [Synechococcaceae cyanobacterium SM2_3_1]|nr:trypsin-like serine protease [Synechococcaceae cyanobacterium SM2_3_1]